MQRMPPTLDQYFPGNGAWQRAFRRVAAAYEEHGQELEWEALISYDVRDLQALHLRIQARAAGDWRARLRPRPL